MPRIVHCVRLKREAEGLDLPPYPGKLGQRIYEQVSKEAWLAWLELQKRLINENRLNLAESQARTYMAEQMERHFFGAGPVDPSSIAAWKRLAAPDAAARMRPVIGTGCGTDSPPWRLCGYRPRGWRW